jgi:hypothetical protein
MAAIAAEPLLLSIANNCSSWYPKTHPVPFYSVNAGPNQPFNTGFSSPYRMKISVVTILLASPMARLFCHFTGSPECAPGLPETL